MLDCGAAALIVVRATEYLCADDCSMLEKLHGCVTTCTFVGQYQAISWS